MIAAMLAALVAFTSEPQGASVEIDGVARGVTPLRVFDLAPGAVHRARFSLPGYESEDVFVSTDDEGSVSKHVRMSPVKGLLLVTSEPSGAKIVLNGDTIGLTPRLVVSLNAKDTHTLVVKKEGYLDSTVEVKFDGRTPMVRHVPLTIDSGTLNITSKPAGANVLVNGKPFGVTPIAAAGVPKGRVSVSLSKEGWQTQSREILVKAGDGQECFFELMPLPASLRLVATPPEARFYVAGDPMGRGPVEMKNLEEGEYLVRVECDGYAPEERKVFVARGKTAFEEFNLQEIVGGLELRTIPAGAMVVIDGKRKGFTEGAPGNPNAASDLFTVSGVAEGRHTLVVKCDGYAEHVEKIEIKSGQTVEKKIKLRKEFRPDYKLVLTTGEVVTGVLVSAEGVNYKITVKPGVDRSIPASHVVKIEPIPAASSGTSGVESAK